MPPDFDEVQLTEEETIDVILQARYKKYFQVKDVQNRLQKEKIIRVARTPFTAEQLGQYVLKNKDRVGLSHFVVDDQARPVFELLCQYFSNSKEFEKDGRSLSKAICLIGPIGAGKSDMMKLFQYNKRRCYFFESVNEVNRHCQEKGIEYFGTFSHFFPTMAFQEKYFFQDKIGWCFDDVGQEEVINDYGNKALVFSKIIQSRYLDKDKIPFDTAHMTSMYNADELGVKYGGYLKSRFREMYNIILYLGNDRRS